MSEMDYALLKGLVGSVCIVNEFTEGRVEKVTENWLMLVDKKGVEYYFHLKKVSSIKRKPSAH